MMLIRAQLIHVIFLSCLSFLEYSNALEYCNGTSWIKFDGNCYLFPTAGISRVSYYDAEDFCRSQGSHLASIHSEEENAFIKNTMRERHSGDRLWIGLNILAGKDNFLWSDGTPVGFTNIVKKEYYVNEKCFITMRSQNGWRPEHCALHYSALCKRSDSAIPTPMPPRTTPEPSKGYCPEGWIQLEEKCYKYFGADENERLQYKQARDACWALGKNHDLVSIHSMKEQAFLTQHLFSLGTSAWIGMRQVTSDEIGHDLVFGWIDNSRTDFTYWAPGHPPPGTWKYCTRLSFEGVRKGEWIADYCETSKQGYICQAPTDSDLPAPVIHPSKCGPDANVGEFRDACYQLVPKLQNQQEAEEACQGLMGGHLVSIVDSFEQAFLYNFIGQRESSIWTGLGRSEGSKYLKWTDKQPVYYLHFDEIESQLVSNDKKCVSLHTTNDLKWNITDCSVKLFSICKIAKDNPPSFPEVTDSCSSDENSIIDIGDKFCYHLAHSREFQIQSWDATSRYCLTRGMKMIEGYSNHQMQSLTAYLHQEMYSIHLGLIRSFDKKSFIRVNGEAPSYTNWDAKEPSSYPGTKDCVAFHPSTGKWMTVSCSGIGVAVCQMPKN
ncbi:hypothetical protein JTE90_002832 [Oedothorax gibbosus]|uniref:C-type lectin domain-containing protein n=1 Tax=Oedothorax gibbosus TaxID=931172 RepID=A0AAV6U6Z0_9ARAC|nr:hypothetical protein JTE90_002832 [Oedothorax gibbosus]